MPGPVYIDCTTCGYRHEKGDPGCTAPNGVSGHSILTISTPFVHDEAIGVASIQTALSHGEGSVVEVDGCETEVAGNSVMSDSAVTATLFAAQINDSPVWADHESGSWGVESQDQSEFLHAHD